ncbi:MAG: MauE/DoxX family redox-associated membrane protein [Mucilaginibacter sp.]
MSQRLIIKNIFIFILVLLWIYAAFSKLLDFNLFKGQMHRQMLPIFLKTSLVYILPPVETSAALLLLFDRTQLAGFIISGALMSAFTIYVGGAVLRFFDHVPCSCGGLLSSMNWSAHLIFNLFFLLLTAIGSIIVYRERRQNHPI